MSTEDFHQSIFQQTRRAAWQSRWPAPAPPPASGPRTPAATGPSCVGSALLQQGTWRRYLCIHLTMFDNAVNLTLGEGTASAFAL